MPEDLVLIARVRKPHGIKGELEIESFSWDENRFDKLKRVFLRDREGVLSERTIESARSTNRGILIRISGIEDRNASESMRGAEIFIPEAERATLPEGRAYHDQIVGMTVIDDETGEAIGAVKSVLDMPASDVFVLDLGGNERLVSNVGEEVVRFDIASKELRVRLLHEY